MVKVYGKIKRSLNDSVKNGIVEIEDNELRDQLLSLLTKLNQQQIELDGANTQMINSLVKRVRDLLQANKELNLKFTMFQERDDAAREAEIQKDLVANQLSEAKAEVDNAYENMREVGLIAQEIVQHVQQCEKMKNVGKTKQNMDLLEVENGL